MSSKQTAVQIAAEIVESILNDALERGVIDDALCESDLPDSAIQAAIELIQYVDRPTLETFFDDLREFRAQAYYPKKE